MHILWRHNFYLLTLHFRRGLWTFQKPAYQWHCWRSRAWKLDYLSFPGMLPLWNRRHSCINNFYCFDITNDDRVGIFWKYPQSTSDRQMRVCSRKFHMSQHSEHYMEMMLKQEGAKLHGIDVACWIYKQLYRKIRPTCRILSRRGNTAYRKKKSRPTWQTHLATRALLLFLSHGLCLALK